MQFIIHTIIAQYIGFVKRIIPAYFKYLCIFVNIYKRKYITVCFFVNFFKSKFAKYMEITGKVCYNSEVHKNSHIILSERANNEMNKQLKSTLILLTAAIIWGFAFVAQCVVDTNVIGNFTFNGTRFLLGAASLIPIILIFEREDMSKKKWKKLFLAAAAAGTALFMASGLQQYGISLTHNAGKSGFITGLYTVLVPIFGWIIWRNKAGVNTWIAAVLAALGLYLLGVSDGLSSIEVGDFVVFIGAFFWTMHILIIDKMVGDVSPIKFSALQFAVCGLWNMIFALIFETITWSGINATAMPILYTGLMSTGVAYTCQIIGQKDSDPNYAAIILSTECVFSAIGGALLLDEVMTTRGYIGCVLIFAGILLSQLKKKGDGNCACEGCNDTAECCEHKA